MADCANRGTSDGDIRVADERRQVQNGRTGHVGELDQGLERGLSDHRLRIAQVVAPVGFGAAGDEGSTILRRRIGVCGEREHETSEWRNVAHWGECRLLDAEGTFPAMIDFAEPPRLVNPWFEEEPVPARVVAAAPVGRQRWIVPAGIAGVLLAAMALLAQLPAPRPRGASSFATTRNQTTAEQLLRQTLGATPTLRGVRTSMATAQVFCRDAQGSGRDSLLVCLGDAVRFAEVYTRMAFRFVSRGDSVVRIVVCPALIASNRSMLPAALRAAARPSLRDVTCWRNPADRTHTEFTYASLPEARKFTTVPEPDAPRMRVESAPTDDTLHVIW